MLKIFQEFYSKGILRLISSTAILLMTITSFNSFAQDRILNIPENLDKHEVKLLPSPVNTPDNLSFDVIRQDFQVTMSDGVIMDCSRFFPSEPNVFLPQGYPIVLMVHGYGGNKEEMNVFAQSQAQYNYVVYTYSVRGQGNSGGLSNLISYTEAQDLIEIVNHIKTEKAITGSDTSRILISGGSQGGTLPYMAATMGLKVRGIISALTSPRFASSWYENGSVKMTMLWSLHYTPSNVRYNDLTTKMRTWAFNSGTKHHTWDSLDYHMPKNRNFDHLVQNNIHTPILIENSWQDYFFNTKDVLTSLPNLNFQREFYFGALMGHGGHTSQSETQWHEQFFNNFLYRYLWNWQYTVYPKYNFAYTTLPREDNHWSFEHGSSEVWLPENVVPLNLFFNSNERLTISANGDPELTEQLKNEVTPGYTLMSAVYSGFTGSEFNQKFKKQSKLFESSPLNGRTKMIGTPKVTLKFKSNSNLPQFNFQLIEKTASNEEFLISRINFTDRNYTPNTTVTRTFEGLSHAHIFSPGSKVVVRMTNFDNHANDAHFLGVNPHVLPSMVNGTHEIVLKDSYIELPFAETDGMFIEPISTADNEITNDIVLNQNFPNPFNPSTMISFTLPGNFAGNVSLIVYDQLGKEIAYLYSGSLNGGTYNFKWNAASHSSGVYYYKLNAGMSTQIRRMLLIK